MSRSVLLVSAFSVSASNWRKRLVFSFSFQIMFCGTLGWTIVTRNVEAGGVFPVHFPSPPAQNPGATNNGEKTSRCHPQPANRFAENIPTAEISDREAPTAEARE